MEEIKKSQLMRESTEHYWNTVQCQQAGKIHQNKKCHIMPKLSVITVSLKFWPEFSRLTFFGDQK